MDYDLWSIELLFTLERKSPSHILSPSTCPLCLTESEGAYLFLVLFFQVLPVEIGFHFSHSADVCDSFKTIVQILVGTSLKPQSQLLWPVWLKLILLKFNLKEISASSKRSSFCGLIVLKLLRLMLHLGVLLPSIL